MAKKKIENVSFEESLQELESIVSQLEQGELNLEDSMTLFERGLTLSKHSQSKLHDAEQKVHLLMNENGTEILVPIESSES
ncbi:MAG: exodeoxyribonuclease VII small subunit [Thalassotalea sp.]